MRALTTINALIWGALSWSGWHGLASFRKVKSVAMIFEILLLVAVFPFLLPHGGGV
jgi:hypothetical protein